MAYLGIDVGSISVKAAVVSADGALLWHEYRRHQGRPLETTLRLMETALEMHADIYGVGCTGSGGKLLAGLLGVPFENEVVAQARAAAQLTPEVNTLIEVGGEDSRLISLEGVGSGVRLRDFAMNSLCAAGCGSFLDQQASRVGVKIEDEFGALALSSERPARVAGRCSVFAKSDMIHLQQVATPVCDIVAGLCYAFARNFVSVVARGKEIVPPVAFHGGVALNAGMVQAFRDLLELQPEQFIVPEHAATAGAAGAALLASVATTSQPDTPWSAQTLVPLRNYLDNPRAQRDAHPALPNPGPPPGSHLADVPPGPPIDAYLGVDVGSISTNVVLIDDEKRVLAKRYLMTAGRPIEAVRQGLEEVGAEWAERVKVRGVCTTGSGRYLTGDFIGADLVKNEITAQARAAAEIDPRVDTIFEIGGQDSKYIALDNGVIVDFEMNKVCAAGTGSFLEEQAERLGVSIKGEFSALAFAAERPVKLGERCTVFMESDLVGQQARGATTPELAAGLAYSIVHNYLNRVVQGKRVGERIFFQGGTAFNRSVVAAFQQVTGKPVTVPEHHEVTGAIGCALMAREAARPGVPSRFKGWDVSKRQYAQDSFECKGCANRCEINRIKIAGEDTLFYGGRCEKYEKKRTTGIEIRDLFTERDRLLTESYMPEEQTAGKPMIGIPRALHFTEYLPFWLAFFQALGLPVRLSSPTNKVLIERGSEATAAEFCFPVKVAHGHAKELIDAGVTHLFVPNVVHLPRLNDGYTESVACPYVQSLPYVLKAALAPEEHSVQMLAPVVDLSGYTTRSARRLHKQLTGLGVSRTAVEAALQAGYAAQHEFGRRLAQIGSEVLAGLKPHERAVVIVSRPYNGCDSGLNLELPRHFRELGVLPIPMDMLPLENINLSKEFPDLAWRYGQKIIGAADLIRQDPRLAAVYLTNFSCGPDSFLLQFFRDRMGGKVFLQIEVDEHSSDVGALTRCEAFLDSLEKLTNHVGEDHHFNFYDYSTDRKRVIYLPNMCDSAYAIAAAFRSVGVPAEVLPESDAESVALAKRHISGKECFPCLTTTGDMLKLLQQPGIEPNEVAFFMPTSSGGCRFSYYNRLQRTVLDSQGFRDVPIYSPNQNDGLYATLVANAGNKFLRRALQGMIASELLQKALHWARPLEQQPGAVDAVYQEYLRKSCHALEMGNDLLPVMQAARAAFDRIPLNPDGHAWIGMVGEIYVRLHRFSNMDLIRRLESLGVHVWLAPLIEWLEYVNVIQMEDSQEDGKWGDLLRVKIVDGIMKKDEHHLAAPWQGFAPNLHETSVVDTIDLGERYVDRAFRGEAILCMGKARDFHAHGLDGLVNVLPFTCMPGTITSALLKRFQHDHDNMPVINLSYDGQGDGNLPIRLEAFVQQCKGYRERRKDGEQVK